MIFKKALSSFRIDLLIFLVILLSTFTIIGLHKCITLRPQSVHQWAQCDRASVALNFGTKTLNIFKPITHNAENGTGITGMEFPFINYVVGILYRIFGFHESIYRLVITLIVVCGLLSAFEISKFFIKNLLISILATLVFLLSPVLMFYTPNFLPEAASMGFVLVGWYYFLKFNQNNENKYLGYLFVFFTLAALIKISSSISIIVIICLIILDKFQFFKRGSAKSYQLHLQKSLLLISLLGSLILVASWYYYANWLSETYQSNVFLLKAKTTFSILEIKEHIEFIRNLWWLQYYPKALYYFILISTVFMIICWKHAPRFLSAICILLWLGNLGFAFMMLSQFRDHDYYIITLLPVIIFHILLFVNVTMNVFQNKKTLSLLIVTVCLTGFAINGLFFCKNNFTERYKAGSWMSSNTKYESYFSLEKHLNKIGASEEAQIISIVDDSPNISLYLMNRQGKSVASYESDNEIDEKINSVSAKHSFIILNDEKYLTRNIQGIRNKEVTVTEGGLYIIRLK